MKSGDTLVIRDGTYSHSTTGVKAGTTIQAANDGKVIFTGSFNPGNAGFTMRGIVVKSDKEKKLGSGNTYRRMSFIGGPSCGNSSKFTCRIQYKNIRVGILWPRRKISPLAYKENGGIIIQDVIFRPDGGWGVGSSCSGYEPHAAYNMYDSEGFTITRAIVVDAISDAGGDSENLGGQVVNTHESHGNVGAISQSVITASGEYGRLPVMEMVLITLQLSTAYQRQAVSPRGLTAMSMAQQLLQEFDTDAR